VTKVANSHTPRASFYFNLRKERYREHYGNIHTPPLRHQKIAFELSLDLQILLWGLIDQLEGDKDYLQVFQLAIADGGQHIVHTQEQPPYRAKYTCPTLADNQQKIFVIDDGTYSTMLWSWEY